MKRTLIILLFSILCFSSFSQTDSLNTDLAKDKYWSKYLLSFGKKSIKSDSTITEAYRLMYWGKYFSIVEIIKKDNLYYITSDSTGWGKSFGKTFRMQDTLTFNDDFNFIKKICDNKDIFISKNNREDYEVIYKMHDDRDNWAFEVKINSQYISKTGIETSDELKVIYEKIMKIGHLTNYVIYPISQQCH